MRIASTILSATLFAVAGANALIPTYNFAGKWGGPGSGLGEFKWPCDIAVAPDGTVYVVEMGMDRVQYFNPEGERLGNWGSEGSSPGQFINPHGIAVARDGSTIYVADTGNNRIQSFTPTGKYIRSWGGSGSNNGQFNLPTDVAVDDYGQVYVADGHNSRVQSFTSQGEYMQTWGSSGYGDGQFGIPIGVDVAPHLAVCIGGTVYVVDRNGVIPNRLQYFALTTEFQGKWRTGLGGEYYWTNDVAVGPDGTVFVVDSTPCIKYFTPTGKYLGVWGSYGSGDGEFALLSEIDPLYYYGPRVAVAPDGTVYVADIGNNRIQYFTPTGPYAGKWGVEGSGVGEFSGPTGIATASGTRVVVYAADTDNHRIQYTTFPAALTGVWGSFGDGPGQFKYPFGVDYAQPTVTSLDDRVFVADTLNNRIQCFESTGTFVREWGSEGTEPGQFKNPIGLAAYDILSVHDPAKRVVYVADRDNHRIQCFDENGNFLDEWGKFGSGDGQFNRPTDVAVNESGRVYVVDMGNHRIQYFDRYPKHNFLGKWGSKSPFLGGFMFPWSIALAPSLASQGNVYVTDLYNCRVQCFSYDGSRFLGQWGKSGSGDGEFGYAPTGVDVADDGTVYVSDVENDRLQYFRP